MARGFVYPLAGRRLPAIAVRLAAVVDLFSRKVLSWKLSITLDTAFCIEAVEETLAKYGKPEIFNTDQGSEFTYAAFTVLLKSHENSTCQYQEFTGIEYKRQRTQTNQ